MLFTKATHCGEPLEYAKRRAAVALIYFAYNFIKVHATMRVTPAMPAGVANRLRSVEDLVESWRVKNENAKQLPRKEASMKGKRRGFGNIRCLKIVPAPNPRKRLASEYATVGFYMKRERAIELATSLLREPKSMRLLT